MRCQIRFNIAALKALIDFDNGEFRWRSGLGIVDELADKGVARPARPTSADPLSPLEAYCSSAPTTVASVPSTKTQEMSFG